MCNWTFFSFNWRKISFLHHPSGQTPLQGARPWFEGGGEDALAAGTGRAPPSASSSPQVCRLTMPLCASVVDMGKPAINNILTAFVNAAKQLGTGGASALQPSQPLHAANS